MLDASKIISKFPKAIKTIRTNQESFIIAVYLENYFSNFVSTTFNKADVDSL